MHALFSLSHLLWGLSRGTAAHISHDITEDTEHARAPSLGFLRLTHRVISLGATLLTAYMSSSSSKSAFGNAGQRLFAPYLLAVSQPNGAGSSSRRICARTTPSLIV